MSGAFDWGDKPGTQQGDLPRHIERMNMGEKKPTMKKSGKSSEGLPWGGEPAEKKKAYQSGPPKNKGSVTGRLGERKSAVGMLPKNGMSGQIKSKSQSVGKKGK